MKRQSCHHMETSQFICSADQLTGFYMIVTLTFNELRTYLPSCENSLQHLVITAKTININFSFRNVYPRYQKWKLFLLFFFRKYFRSKSVGKWFFKFAFGYNLTEKILRAWSLHRKSVNQLNFNFGWRNTL